MKKVIGMGNALVDILIKLENETLLERFSLPKGSMQLVDANLSNHILKEIEGMKQSLVSGGSASNTIHGLAALGMQSGFIGKVGSDKLGDFFVSDMQKNNINTTLFRSETETGRAIALISPDSERTFATYLGAAVELTAKDISPEIFEGYDILHIEGYLVQNHELIETALIIAKQKRLVISLDLASFNVVEENRDFLLDLTEKYVDILFANEDEAKVFSQQDDDEKALEFMSKRCVLAILKKGAQGSVSILNGNKMSFKAIPAESIDTTGAGDLYAAGFLYGIINDASLDKCGLIAAHTAAEVIKVIGPKIDAKKWTDIKTVIDKILN